MNKTDAVALYSGLATSQKLIVLLDIMQQLTIVVRSVFHDYGKDPAVTSRLAYAISEMNHRLTAAATALLTRTSGLPDDFLFAIFYDPPQHIELMEYFPFVLQQALQRLKL